MKKLLSLLILYFVYTAGNAMNFLLPEDGSVQPRMLLDLDVPDSDVVYLAEADVIADIDYYSSSVISAYKTPVKSIPFRLSILIWLLF